MSTGAPAGKPEAEPAETTEDLTAQLVALVTSQVVSGGGVGTVTVTPAGVSTPAPGGGGGAADGTPASSGGSASLTRSEQSAKEWRMVFDAYEAAQSTGSDRSATASSPGSVGSELEEKEEGSAASADEIDDAAAPSAASPVGTGGDREPGTAPPPAGLVGGGSSGGNAIFAADFADAPQQASSGAAVQDLVGCELNTPPRTRGAAAVSPAPAAFDMTGADAPDSESEEGTPEGGAGGVGTGGDASPEPADAHFAPESPANSDDEPFVPVGDQSKEGKEAKLAAELAATQAERREAKAAAAAVEPVSPTRGRGGHKEVVPHAGSEAAAWVAETTLVSTDWNMTDDPDAASNHAKNIFFREGSGPLRWGEGEMVSPTSTASPPGDGNNVSTDEDAASSVSNDSFESMTFGDLAGFADKVEPSSGAASPSDLSTDSDGSPNAGDGFISGDEPQAGALVDDTVSVGGADEQKYLVLGTGIDSAAVSDTAAATSLDADATGGDAAYSSDEQSVGEEEEEDVFGDDFCVGIDGINSPPPADDDDGDDAFMADSKALAQLPEGGALPAGNGAAADEDEAHWQAATEPHDVDAFGDGAAADADEVNWQAAIELDGVDAFGDGAAAAAEATDTTVARPSQVGSAGIGVAGIAPAAGGYASDADGEGSDDDGEDNGGDRSLTPSRDSAPDDASHDDAAAADMPLAVSAHVQGDGENAGAGFISGVGSEAEATAPHDYSAGSASTTGASDDDSIGGASEQKTAGDDDDDDIDADPSDAKDEAPGAARALTTPTDSALTEASATVSAKSAASRSTDMVVYGRKARHSPTPSRVLAVAPAAAPGPAAIAVSPLGPANTVKSIEETLSAAIGDLFSPTEGSVLNDAAMDFCARTMLRMQAILDNEKLGKLRTDSIKAALASYLIVWRKLHTLQTKSMSGFTLTEEKQRVLAYIITCINVDLAMSFVATGDANAGHVSGSTRINFENFVVGAVRFKEAKGVEGAFVVNVHVAKREDTVTDQQRHKQIKTTVRDNLRAGKVPTNLDESNPLTIDIAADELEFYQAFATICVASPFSEAPSFFNFVAQRYTVLRFALPALFDHMRDILQTRAAAKHATIAKSARSSDNTKPHAATTDMTRAERQHQRAEEFKAIMNGDALEDISNEAEASVNEAFAASVSEMFDSLRKQISANDESIKELRKEVNEIKRIGIERKHEADAQAKRLARLEKLAEERAASLGRTLSPIAGDAAGGAAPATGGAGGPAVSAAPEATAPPARADGVKLAPPSTGKLLRAAITHLELRLEQIMKRAAEANNLRTTIDMMNAVCAGVDNPDIKTISARTMTRATKVMIAIAHREVRPQVAQAAVAAIASLLKSDITRCENDTGRKRQRTADAKADAERVNGDPLLTKLVQYPPSSSAVNVAVNNALREVVEHCADVGRLKFVFNFLKNWKHPFIRNPSNDAAKNYHDAAVGTGHLPGRLVVLLQAVGSACEVRGVGKATVTRTDCRYLRAYATALATGAKHALLRDAAEQAEDTLRPLARE
eukprot:CAMPEP_0203834626 /NCGR_PEP_ID=MMETSP0115-20131106/73253_1 /ASSEMBLY_ACC=CAM_ASM_000227 /TAXON_ID=33651 /ORGANISM="Bicosoecid sp, Strain ms1" /LENGTH=1528 /DNA_ID=CAMNT_0050743705 /DNA_START=184 /DNA_END=4770 /DNA_ORIENTATION=-